MAWTRAAKPAAEDARPAAVGKLFSDTILRGRLDSLGKEESVFSRAARLARSSRKHACVRAPEMSDSSPFRVRVSPSLKLAEHEAVVRVRRSAWERVTEMELLVGRLSLASRLPQYLQARMRG